MTTVLDRYFVERRGDVFYVRKAFYEAPERPGSLIQRVTNYRDVSVHSDPIEASAECRLLNHEAGVTQ